VPKDFENFNISFSENYILRRDKYFESEKDEVKLATFYENKYRAIFFEVVLHIVFLAILILLLFFNSLPSWHYIIHDAVKNALDNLSIPTPNGSTKSIYSTSTNLLK
jgi:hypothetical protein